VCDAAPVLECVVNISEGRRPEVLAELADAAKPDLLDVHTDPDHHRSVFTVVGEAAPRRRAATAVAALDLRRHDGVHPRIGVVDVVPFVPLAGATFDDAVQARDDFGRWAAAELGVPSFRYGPERSLPEVRRHAFTALVPDFGGSTPHRTAGAMAIGARSVLVAYNVWVTGSDLSATRRMAAAVREPRLRTLGLDVGGRMQVSMNLVAPHDLGPAEAFDVVAKAARAQGAQVDGAELVGLIPAEVLHAIAPERWSELDLGAERTIEARVAARDRAGGL